MGYTYIFELHNRYTGFIRVMNINIIHHLMDRYRKITKKYLKEDQKIFG